MDKANRLEQQKLRQRAYRQKMRTIRRPGRADIAAITLNWIVEEANLRTSERTRDRLISKIIALVREKDFDHRHALNVVE